MNTCRLVALVLAHICFLSQPNFAQAISIAGTVQDITGVIRDAEVTLRDPLGGTSKTTTDAAGQYHFNGLRPGAYEIGFTRKGFAPETRSVNLTAETKAVDVTLQVA